MPSSKTLGTYQGDDEVEYEANGHNRTEYVIETHCGSQTRAGMKIERRGGKGRRTNADEDKVKSEAHSVKILFNASSRRTGACFA
jgi:hypothetical protein